MTHILVEACQIQGKKYIIVLKTRPRDRPTILSAIFIILSIILLFLLIRYVCGGKGDVSLEKQWSDWAVAYPLQVTVKVYRSLVTVFVSPPLRTDKCYSLISLVSEAIE